MLKFKCMLKYFAELEASSALDARLPSPSPASGAAPVRSARCLQAQGLK